MVRIVVGKALPEVLHLSATVGLTGKVFGFWSPKFGVILGTIPTSLAHVQASKTDLHQ